MSLPNQIAAYEDCFELFDKANDDKVGARAKLPDMAGAKMMQMRMHNARALTRMESRRLYPKGDLRWDKSQYDALKVSVKQDTEGGWWVYVTRHGQEIETIETLSEAE
jgi:hypothetical protein